MQFWNELEGKVTGDGYRLGRLVRSEGRTAWFETETTDAVPQPATISLTESLTDADEVIARLQAAQRLRNSSLMTIRKIGRAQLDQTPFVYALMEHADQNLADILRYQPLSKDEARQVAEAMVSALTAIHQEGMVHGRVEPASILAVGEAVKLRSDCLQTPGGTRAGDVAGIGETLFQVFLQRKAASAQDPQINRIPAPFAEMVRNSLSSRWGLAQVAAVLKPAAAPTVSTASSAAPAMPRPPAAAPPGVTPQPPAPETHPPPGTAKPVAASAAPESPISAPAIRPIAAAGAASSAVAQPAPVSNRQGPLLETQIPRDGRSDDQEAEEDRPPARRATWIYAALGVVIVLILGWLLLRPKPPRSAGHEAGIAAQHAPPPAPAAPATAAIQPPATRTSSSAQQTEVAPTEKRSVWRVVAYTYHHQDQAQQKADEINHAHPGLNASAYSPPGDSRHCLVVLGGAMDRREAFALRDEAVKDGLAADTYVQNFSE